MLIYALILIIVALGIFLLLGLTEYSDEKAKAVLGICVVWIYFAFVPFFVNVIMARETMDANSIQLIDEIVKLEELKKRDYVDTVKVNFEISLKVRELVHLNRKK
jgi:MFS-type transporter involved in bile tolerance (Atg22 family)